MAKEIERKFLLKHDGWRREISHSERLCQGYLSSDPKCSIRVRISATQGFLNIKSATLGIERQEYEYEIPLADAEELLTSLCQQPCIDKTRHYVHHAGHLWEIDEFDGANAGLVVAEIELDSAEASFTLPDWCGAEVSADPRYYNVLLVQHPYREWRDQTPAKNSPQ